MAQYLGLAHLRFELQGAHDLAQLAAAGALVLALEKARNLHRQRRAAGYDAAVTQHLGSGAS